MTISRRDFLAGSTAIALSGGWAHAQAAGAPLVAAPARATILPDRRETEVWSYNGGVPGPTLRFRQGERARIEVENRLDQETTVHWHGVRLPNAMDGVPQLTQKPILPGGRFVYEFDLPDAGTFWYHPHMRSSEQVERGLSGAFIVDERVAPAVDRDLVWLLDDWRLTPEATIAGEFGNRMDASHAGRIGNTVTINGRVPTPLAVRAGERLRLRLINAANARVFGLDFGALAPLVIALDGQPVEPHAPAGGRVVLGPAMRADLLIDVGGAGVFAVRDSFYRQGTYKLIDLVADGTGSAVRREPLRLPANPLAQPDLAAAERFTIEFGGGMMDPRMMREARERGGRPDPETLRLFRERMQSGHIWSINGRSMADHAGHHLEPLLSLQHGRSYILAMHNDTAWHHPMHLHGMTFRLLSRNGAPVPHGEWRDTALLDPGERLEIAFVADNPGDWMFHCHVLEHQEAGMMGVFRVSQAGRAR